MAQMFRRKNGFQKPHSTDQIMSMVAHPLVVILYFFAISFVLPLKEFAWAYIPVALLAALVVSCWYKLESEDPASLHKGYAWGRLNRGARWNKERYCGSCKKTVPGLDHHCTWLNTCVGVRNYPYFFVLAISGTIQLGLQVVIGIFAVAVWVEQDERLRSSATKAFSALIGYRVFSAVHLLVAVLCFVGLASLLAFHSYLTARNLTTYDWVLSFHLADTNRGHSQQAKPPLVREPDPDPGCGGQTRDKRTAPGSRNKGRIAPTTDDSSPPQTSEIGIELPETPSGKINGQDALPFSPSHSDHLHGRFSTGDSNMNLVSVGQSTSSTLEGSCVKDNTKIAHPPTNQHFNFPKEG